MSTVVDALRLVATPDQWAGAVLLACALLLVRLGSRRLPSGPSRPARPGPGPAILRGVPRWLAPLATRSMALRRPAPDAAGTPHRPQRTPPVVDASAVARLARGGSDAGEIARRTGLARDAVRLVLLRDGAPPTAGAGAGLAPMAAAARGAAASAPPRRAPGGADAGDAAPRDRAMREPTIHDLAAARRARSMPAIPDARAARDPRHLDERTRAAEAGRGTRFSAMIR